MPDGRPSSPAHAPAVQPHEPTPRMTVVSQGPLPVGSCIWQPRPGALTFTFVCKATFVLAPGLLTLASDQEPVHADDRALANSGNGATSLYAAADLGPGKPRADVVLVGKAYAPGAVAVRSLVVRLSVAGVDKSVHVWCDRKYAPDGTLVEGPPFLDLPLLYERTAGGPGTGNPVGMPAARDGTGSMALPNLTIPFAPAVPDMPMTAAGFGPIAAHWPSRRARLGRNAVGWGADSWRHEPLPADMDPSYFNVAPEDQQLESLAGNERLVLENLHPEIPDLCMVLPGLALSARLDGPKGEEPVELVCDTLWIDTERGLCTLTYRGHVPLGSTTDEGCVTVTLEPLSESRPGAREQALPLRAPEAPERPPIPSAPPFVGAPKLNPVAPQLRSSPWGMPLGKPPLGHPVPPSASGSGASPDAPGEHSPMDAPAGGRGSRPFASFGAAFGGTAPPSDSQVASTRAAPAELSREEAHRMAPGRRQVVASLLCHETAIVPRMRKTKRLAAVLATKSRERRAQSLDETQREAPPDERSDVLRVLSCGQPADAGEIRRALTDRLEDQDDLDLPLLLIAGELRPTFDETELLRATIAVAQPVAKGDKKVLAAIALGQEAVAAPVALRPETSLRIVRQIEQATESLSLPARYVAAEVERVVLEGRKYKRRTILGAPRLRAELTVPKAGEAWPIYLPETVAASLPLLLSFPVVALCEITAREDVAEAQPQALVAAALARVLLSRQKDPR